MPQTQNIFKLSLLAIFCLALFSVAGEAKAATTIINPDKTLSINGVKTFPQIFYAICSGTYAIGAQCVTNLQRMSIYDADISAWATMTNPQHEQEGMGYINMVSSGTRYKDNNNFFGYIQVDEPISTGANIAALEQAYKDIKAKDPNHVVMAVDWTRLNNLRNMADIIMDDGYTYSDVKWLNDIGYTRQTALYWKESTLRNSADALRGVSDFDGISKPVYPVIQALSQPTPDGDGVQAINKSELRAVIFLAITMNMKGLAYFSYNEHSVITDSTKLYGLVRDQTMTQWYIDQASEIKALNDILVLPTKDYSWQHRQGTQVNFSKVLTASGSTYINGYTNFNYMLKQDGSVYYLIVLNKDTRPISDVAITVSGLNGPMTAKKIIGSSTVANQDAPVTNGVFTDSFDGLAVHVYQIYSGSNPPAFPTPSTPTPDEIDPAITITCPVNSATPPATPPTYSSNIISLSGTAKDAVGVTSVTVKDGNGVWHDATIIGEGWEIFNIALSSANSGVNTITAKATDAAGNFKETSITVTYSTTIPPAVSGTPAFPEAQGGGAESIGGRGGRVIYVTNLNSEGPGSLREAMEASGPRIVVFNVGGIIHLKRTTANPNGYIKITNPYLTVAGQTAPGGGITVRGRVVLSNASNIILRFLTIRPGKSPDYPEEDEFTGYEPGMTPTSADSLLDDAISMWGGKNNIFDHLSISWANDENVEVYNSGDRITSNVTFSQNLIAEAFRPHHAAMLISAAPGSTAGADGVNEIFVHHNLIMKALNRMPWAISKDIRIVNNIMYNRMWTFTQIFGGIEADVIGNIFKDQSVINDKVVQWFSSAGENPIKPGDPSIYIQENISNNQNADNWNMVGIGKKDAPISWRRFNPLFLPKYPVTLDPVATLENFILNDVGNSRRIDENGNWVNRRDSVDLRLINEYRTNTGILPWNENEVGGWPIIAAGTPYTDSDNDGMSNIWEQKYGFNINDPADGNGDADNDGYTNIEEFINGSDPKVANASSGNLPPTCTAPSATIPPTTPITPPPPPVVCGDSVDGKCPDGCTYLEDIDCPLPFVPDTTPPTIPQKLTATGSITVPAIDLKWRASIDDKGVTGYNVYRDGIKIATVNRVSYTDANVIFGETHTYTVTAFDLSGNESAKSNPASAMSAPLNAEFMKSTSASGLSQLVGNFLKWILTVAGSLALLIIITGGVMYASSTGNEQRVILSKKIVLGAIGGLILILMAYSIITLLGRIV